MSSRRQTERFDVIRALKKSFVSIFVVFTFAAYAIHQHFDGQIETAATASPVPQTYVGQQVKPEAPQVALAGPQPTASPTQKPSATPTKPPAKTSPTSAPTTTAPDTAAPASSSVAVVPPTATAVPPTATAVPPTKTAPAPANPAQAAGQYKDGSYTGPSVNAYWGQVQVRAVVQNGQITNVDVLDYPADRRTSQRINSYAIPYLQQETIQAQSARVNMVSGATLTSKAYIQSLQAALDNARSGA
ncbi:MAG: FMN-binding protein [Anaerolineae bacterium]